MDIKVIGRWAFILGLIICVLAGLGGRVPMLLTILFVLGLVVGLLNVTEKESTSFLVAVVALLLIGVAGLQLGQLTSVVASILNNLIVFTSAAGLVVAIKQVVVIAEKAR
ncbi:MAG: hypothetical protein NTW46_01600 [Candidatus Nealsonbacteria bacterium]|nr:hypothetical protein [Candidatus Nealsonbacteria bacterium]